MRLIARQSFVMTATGALCLAFVLLSPETSANRGGGGARTSVHRGGAANVNRNANINRNANVNVNRNANVNRNVNVDRNVSRNANVNVDRNVNVNRYNHVDVNYRNGWNNPVGTAVAIGATAAVVGSIIYSLPPSCSMIEAGGVTYQRCGSTWYQPRYAGTSVQYVVVNAPY